MKKSITALALAFALVGTLAACSTDRNPSNNSANTGTNGGTSGTANGSGAGASAGQVGRRYNTFMNQGRNYFYDGQYSADANGQVYGSDGNAVSRDLTRGARDIVRGTEDVMDDIGRGVGNAVQDITGNGTPSWEPDSSAARQ